MDLAWFWRGWFLEDAMLDIGVEGVRNGSRGARITFVNYERMVMPLTFEVTYEDDSTEVIRLPVEAWSKSDKITRTVRSDMDVVEVRIDPDGMLPDIRRKNNRWKEEDGPPARAVSGLGRGSVGAGSTARARPRRAPRRARRRRASGTSSRSPCAGRRASTCARARSRRGRG